MLVLLTKGYMKLVICPRIINDESSSREKITLVSKEIDVREEGKKLNKLGRSRSRNKGEFPLECATDADADQQSQGVPSSREERVSSLKTVSCDLQK